MRSPFISSKPSAAVLVMLLAAWNIYGNAQKQSQRPELFREWVSNTAISSRTTIPLSACRIIISQAHQIVTSHGGFRRIEDHDLVTASLNLRVCYV